MRIGKLDRLVTIQEYTSVRDAYGGVMKSWQDARKEKANYYAGKGSERRVAGQEQSSLPATFTFHSSVLTRSMTPESHRIIFDGGEWDIISPAAIDRNRFISFEARRRTS